MSQKKVEWHFSGRLTFQTFVVDFSSNTTARSRNAFFRQSKSKISLFNEQFARFIRRMTKFQVAYNHQ